MLFFSTANAPDQPFQTRRSRKKSPHLVVGHRWVNGGEKDNSESPLQGPTPRRKLDLLNQTRKPGGGDVIFPVGQNVKEALELAHYAYVLQTGCIVMEGKPADLLQSDMIKKAYLGL